MEVSTIANYLLTKLYNQFVSTLSIKTIDVGDLSDQDYPEDPTEWLNALFVVPATSKRERSNQRSLTNDKNYKFMVVYCRANTDGTKNNELRMTEGDSVADFIDTRIFWDTLRTTTFQVTKWKTTVNYDNAVNDIFKAVGAKMGAITIDVDIETLQHRA